MTLSLRRVSTGTSDRHIFKRVSLNENIKILNHISPEFLNVPISNRYALFQPGVGLRTGNFTERRMQNVSPYNGNKGVVIKDIW